MIDLGLSLAIAALVAGALETVVGEPPAAYHPVSVLGRTIERVEPLRFGAPKLAGTAYALAIPIGCAVLTYGLLWIVEAGPLPAVATLLAGVVLWVSSSLRMLLESGRRVMDASETDTEAAREALLALVGRDTDALPPELIRSAAVESLAENLSDGLIAPLLAFTALSFVSLPAATAGAVFVKAVNTMDSMLGYPGRFGWASARLDDIVMFVPARISALLLAISAGDPDAPLRARRYVRKPASPNAGWPMGTLAAALNVRLEKPGVYVLNDVANYPTIGDSRNALAATRRAGITAYALVATVGVIRWL